MRREIPVEKQWIVGASGNGITVLPGRAVVGSPESYTVYHVTVCVEYPEQFLIPVGELLLHLCGKPVLIRVKEFLELLQLDLRLRH